MKKHLAIVMLVFLPHASWAAGLDDLSGAEQSYHEKIFDYVMNNVDPDKSYDWSSFSGKGTIKVGQPFVSKSRSSCRPFAEDFTIGGSAGAISGYACKRAGDDGWCRLKTGAMLSCALENPGYSIGGGSYSVSAPTVHAPDVNVGDINAPNVTINGPNISAPNIHAPTLGGGHGSGPNTQPSRNNGGNGKGEASDTAYSVTDTLGNGAAQGTGMALGWFSRMFR